MLVLEVQVPGDRADGAKGLRILLSGLAVPAARLKVLHTSLSKGFQELGWAGSMSVRCSAVSGSCCPKVMTAGAGASRGVLSGAW